MLLSYLEQLDALAAELSISSELATVSDKVRALADASGDNRRRAAMSPTADAIAGVYARLCATLCRCDGTETAAAIQLVSDGLCRSRQLAQ